MPETRVADLFNPPHRFLRSAQLERDFTDPRALEGYVLTPQTRSNFERLASGLRDGSGQRAWRVTGDYGSGKSSFALVLAHLFGERRARLPENIRNCVDFRKLGISRPRMLPVLVTGSSEPLAVALLRALVRELHAQAGRGRLPGVTERIHAEIKRAQDGMVSDEAVVDLVSDANSHVIATNKGSGILIILDELGKFLEYGALHPQRQDVSLLQALAEASSRSGKKPLFIVGLLHQGFQAYADQLTQSAQREWEKVAGRFDEILFNQPLEDSAALVADALNVRNARVPQELRIQAQRDMQAILELGWYGPSASSKRLLGLAARLFPLHPSVIPVLIKLFNRFGQNERSLFSFLLSDEPFGLQEFARRPIGESPFYRIHHLYDYARSTFGHRLSLQSFRSHWNHIESMIGSFLSSSGSDLQVLKTVGLLNLLDTSSFVASEDAVRLSLAGQAPGAGRDVQSAVRRLKSKRILYQRGIAGGYCLWPFTSVNLDKVYEDASKALGQSLDLVGPRIQEYLDARPLVARRHYIKTGNLRHFEVHYSPVEQLSTGQPFECEAADGRIVVALCESEAERQEGIRLAEANISGTEPSTLWAIPNPLRALNKLVQEVQRWEWISANTPELTNDSFAAEEVSRQIAGTRRALTDRLRTFVGLQRLGGSELQWYSNGKRLPISSGRELLSHLSSVCDEVYPQAPRVPNELINRRLLSSAAAAARMRLIEDIFAGSSKPYLGMNPTKKPPEMSIYLSLLKESRVHREISGKWVLRVPDQDDDPCNLRPALERIYALLESAGMSKLPVATILRELRRPPFGVREGLAPVLLAVFAAMNEHHLAFYDNGVFMREMVGLDLRRLTKLPESFEMQFCRIEGIRSELFNQLLKVIGAKPAHKERPDILDVVRPLCVFAAQLPAYVHKTRKMSAHATAVRTALLTAREPAMLLFRELPSACGFPEFSTDRRKNTATLEEFVEVLKRALNEMRVSYPLLHEHIRTALGNAFDLNASVANFRSTLSTRTKSVMRAVTEPQLRAFCSRLADAELPDLEWTESVGSLVCGTPPSKWTDADLDKYHEDLAALTGRFRRVESLGFGRRGAVLEESALRVAVTQLDGLEVDLVIYLRPEQEAQAAEVEARVSAILSNTESAGIAGAARAFWRAIERKGAISG